MKKNVFLISSIRQPLRALVLTLLLGLISYAFITKAVGYILVQRETEVLGSYYRSIGILDNTKDPQSGDVSAGIDLIKTSPDFAYGDQREVVSGVMSQTFNRNFSFHDSVILLNTMPMEYWSHVHDTDIWFSGELLELKEAKTVGIRTWEGKTIGYSLKFHIDSLYAAYPEDARQDGSIVLAFQFTGNEAAIPIIEEMTVGQRYLIHGWDDIGSLDNNFDRYGARFQLLPLDDQPLWYLPVAKNENIDFSTPEMASIKNRIDILNENLHTLGIIATADMSAMPLMQEAAHFYFLKEGRLLNHQDDLDGNKVIVMPDCLAEERGLKLGDEIQLTFRPLKDTYYGHIRDGVDTALWRSYATYQDTYKIVGIVGFTQGCAYSAYIPTGSLRPGFTSDTQKQFRDEAGYSFVLNSSRSQTQFTQEYQDSLAALGISLTFLDNNGAAYWAAVDPIRSSSAADVLIFGGLMIAALIMAIFLYLMQRKRDYAISRALGVPQKQANRQLTLPLLLIGGLGIVAGGLPAWNSALDQAKANLSSLPTPAGVSPSADLNPFFLAGICLVIFLLLTAFSWMGVLLLSRKPVFELLQGQTNPAVSKQKHDGAGVSVKSSSQNLKAADTPGKTQAKAAIWVEIDTKRKYSPLSLGRYVIHHGLRSRFKSILTLVIALGFMLTSGWIRQTIQRSQTEIDRLYDTTVIEADIIKADPAAQPMTGSYPTGSGFVYLNTVISVQNSGAVIGSALEAETVWPRIQAAGTGNGPTGVVTAHAYDGPETLIAGLAEPGSLTFAPGWDISIFEKEWTLAEIQSSGIPIVFPSETLEETHLKVGDRVKVSEYSGTSYPGIVVGQYSGGRAVMVNGVKMNIMGGYPALVPLSVIEAMNRSKTKFTAAHFILDPTKNRELAQFSAEMDQVVKAPNAGTCELRFVIWDEQLRVVVVQLEKNISILQVLYPIVMAVSVLIGAGLCFLLLLQTAKEAAVMRVLGITQTAVRLALISEPLFLSILGVILGLGLSAIVWMSPGVALSGESLAAAGMYLAGALAGLSAGAILVTNNKPIELLQVKE